MSEEQLYSFESIKEGCLRILNPSFIGDYPFEYVFRLLLVYCYTNKGAISKIRAEDMNAFDSVFSEPLKQAIGIAANFRGAVVDEDLLLQLSQMANKTFGVYVKNQMKMNPSKVSHSLSMEMDEALSSAEIKDRGSLLFPIFAE